MYGKPRKQNGLIRSFLCKDVSYIQGTQANNTKSSADLNTSDRVLFTRSKDRVLSTNGQTDWHGLIDIEFCSDQ